METIEKADLKQIVTGCKPLDWIIQHTSPAPYDDLGTMQFIGTLPARVMQELTEYAKSINALRRDTGKNIVYSWRISEYIHIHFMHGAYKSTQNTIRLYITHDYPE